MRASTQKVTNTSFSVTVDDLVVARARKGDIEAFERLYRTFEIPVYNLARRVCRTPQDAEDVVQETFLEVVRSIARFRGDGSLAGWVRKVAASKALMKIRRQSARGIETEIPDDFPGADRVTGTHTLTPEKLDLEAALDHLSDTARGVLWLHDVEGYSHDEIGAMWGKSASFSKSQLARAHARLRDLLSSPTREETCT